MGSNDTINDFLGGFLYTGGGICRYLLPQEDVEKCNTEMSWFLPRAMRLLAVRRGGAIADFCGSDDISCRGTWTFWG